jgi:GNAT superfamily N-acetyltransferase
MSFTLPNTPLTLATVPYSDRERGLQLRWSGDSPALPSPAAWRDALDVVLGDAHRAGIHRVEARVVTRDADRDEALIAARAASARAALTARGFVHDDGRAEFRLPLDRDHVARFVDAHAARDPFAWDALAPAGAVDFARAAAAMQAASVGDPMSSPDEEAAAAIREALADASLTHDPMGVQVGALDGADAAFVMAQVSPTTGWSRITYLGVLPAFRGRGLGAFVHARGLSLARTLGGRLYVGGTSTRNAPMLALFQKLGAEEFRTMERWTITPDGRGDPTGAPSRP